MTKAEDIAQSILDTRQEIIVSWLRGPDGAELLRLEKAFKALTNQEPPSIAAVAAAVNGSLHLSNEADNTPMPTVKPKEPRPVRAAARELLSTSDRAWTFDEMTDQFDRQGEQFAAKSIRDALRTAVLQLVADGKAERVSKGRYRGVPQVSVTEVGDSLPPLGDGEGEG